MFTGKKIILGVTGSISAYKSALIVRLLVKNGAEVKVIMTHSAKDFITPLTLATLSNKPVLIDFVKNEQGEWTNHVELGLWADLMLMAPASANTIAKCANGLCDNLLTAVYLSAKCPVYIAPAMDLDMYKHPAHLANLAKLQSYGNNIIEAEKGELASGLVGQGRLAEPEHILEFLEQTIQVDDFLKGKRILITAGPTQEDLDPVRFISNHSSGKMGFEIARSFRNAGASVTLVAGPVALIPPANINTIHVRSAEEMYQAVSLNFKTADVIIYTAAVADYKPAEYSQLKIKKKDDELSLPLAKNRDIAGSMATQKSAQQIVVGFALETNNEEQNALAKLQKKNFDLVVLNSLQDKGAGFRYDTNKISILFASGQKKTFDLKSKKEVAQDILKEVSLLLKSAIV